MSKAPAAERAIVSFVHYETKEVREVKEPVKYLQFSRAFIAAFITSEEHYQELPWYREMVDAELSIIKAENPGIGDADLQIKAFPKVRAKFIEKFFPQYKKKERSKRANKPVKLDMWNL